MIRTSGSVLEGLELHVGDHHELAFILEAIPVPIAYVSSSLHHSFANHAYANWLGLTRERVRETTLEEALGRAACERLKPHLDAVLSGSAVNFEADLPCRTGTRHVRASYVPRRCSHGSIAGFIAHVHDRTDEVHALRAERLLARASQRLADSLDGHATMRSVVELAVPELADLCVLHDVQSGHRITLTAATPACRLADEVIAIDRTWPLNFGQSSGAAKVLFDGVAELSPELTKELLASEASCPEHLHRLLGLGFGSRMCVPVCIDDGTRLALTFLRGKHNPAYEKHDLLLAEELGRRSGNALHKAALYKSARESIRRGEEFLSVASHELRTPLTTLQLRAQSVAATLRDQFGDSPLTQSADKMGSQVRRLTALVQELLDGSRIAGGVLRLQPRATDLCGIVRQCADRMAEDAERTGCSITVSCPSELVGQWDATYLESAISNLLSNAIKFGGGKPVELDLRAAPSEAILVVRDRGIGIAYEDQQRIFERFERAVSASHFGGLGLGLWITKQIVQASGGVVYVESQPGEGARFVVRLPLKAA